MSNRPKYVAEGGAELLDLLDHGCFTKLKIAAEKLFKEDAAKIDLIMENDKFKELVLHHIPLLREVNSQTQDLNERANLDEKHWEKLESVFLSTMIWCDQRTQTLRNLQDLADQVQDAGADKNCFNIELSAAFTALHIFNKRLNLNFIDLASPLRTVGNRDKEETARKWWQKSAPSVPLEKQMKLVDIDGYDFLDIKSIGMLQRQIDTWFGSVVVILFCDKAIPSWEEIVLPRFGELSDKYIFRDDIKFFTVAAKDDILKTFNVVSIPTAVVINGKGEEVGRISITEITTLATFFKKLDVCVGKHEQVFTKDMPLSSSRTPSKKEKK